VTLLAAVPFVPGSSLQTLVDLAWIPMLGARYHLAVDGISLTLLVLTGLAATAGVLFSWNIASARGSSSRFTWR
jgi:NADH-quinone oxidoreductase subunit M